jgi:hypothetical protein
MRMPAYAGALPRRAYAERYGWICGQQHRGEDLVPAWRLDPGQTGTNHRGSDFASEFGRAWEGLPSCEHDVRLAEQGAGCGEAVKLGLVTSVPFWLSMIDTLSFFLCLLYYMLIQGAGRYQMRLHRSTSTFKNIFRKRLSEPWGSQQNALHESK